MKNKNVFDLDPERLATTDEFGNRVYLYPEDVRGVWKNRRTFVYWCLICFYLILPWIYINGRPALMLNISKGEFSFFGSILFGIEPILLFLLAASGIFTIAGLTSLYGRIWCGWACPQTVFIQTIFLKVEALIEGSARKRREDAKSPWSFTKILKKILKWFVYTLLSLHIAHTFLGYFVGPRELLDISMGAPSAHPTLFFLTMTATLVILFDFGWFREQFCIIACPYGRMQSVVMDENSLVVSYDAKRGEPRRGMGNDTKPEGDCINCYHCVKVCPTGIDIRRGTQLECIACTQCIDACDEIMTKIKKPKGLIKYSSENELNGNKRKKITVRFSIYMFITTLFVSSIVFFIVNLSSLQLIFLRNAIPFQIVDSGNLVVNQFVLKVTHQGERIHKLNFLIKESDLRDKVEIMTPSRPTIIDLQNKKMVILFKFPKNILRSGSRIVTVHAVDAVNHQNILATKEVVLVGPAD